jgi:hypothetical protein
LIPTEKLVMGAFNLDAALPKLGPCKKSWVHAFELFQAQLCPAKAFSGPNLGARFDGPGINRNDIQKSTAHIDVTICSFPFNTQDKSPAHSKKS